MSAFLLAVLVPQIAWGEECPNVSLSTDGVVPRYDGRSDTPANLVPPRPQNEIPAWIDYEDCKDDIRLQFTLLAGGLPCTDTIQVWAGTTDCTQVSARQASSGATRCWPVTPPGAFAMAASTTADIRAQDIVAFIHDANPPTSYSPQGQSACQSLAHDSDGTPLGLYFVAIEADGQTVDGTSALYGSSSGAGVGSGPWGAVRNPPDGGPSGPGADAGSGDLASGGSGAGGCRMTPGRGSDIGAVGGVGIAALVFGRRGRRARPRVSRT